MTKKITNPNYASINLMYFMSNFPHNFISECWKNEPNFVEHLEEKFRKYSEKYGNGSLGFPKFFYELDRENQHELVEWINTNYFAFNEFVEPIVEPIVELANNVTEYLQLKAKDYKKDFDSLALSIEINGESKTINVLSLEDNGYDATDAFCIDSIRIN